MNRLGSCAASIAIRVSSLTTAPIAGFEGSSTEWSEPNCHPYSPLPSVERSLTGAIAFRPASVAENDHSELH